MELNIYPQVISRTIDGVKTLVTPMPNQKPHIYSVRMRTISGDERYLASFKHYSQAKAYCDNLNDTVEELKNV